MRSVSTCCGALRSPGLPRFCVPLHCVLTFHLFIVIFGRNAWTISSDRVPVGAAPSNLKTIEEFCQLAKGSCECRAQLESHARRSSSRKLCFPQQCQPSLWTIRLGLIFALMMLAPSSHEFRRTWPTTSTIWRSATISPAPTRRMCSVILVSVVLFIALEKAERRLRPVN